MFQKIREGARSVKTAVVGAVGVGLAAVSGSSWAVGAAAIDVTDAVETLTNQTTSINAIGGGVMILSFLILAWAYVRRVK